MPILQNLTVYNFYFKGDFGDRIIITNDNDNIIIGGGSINNIGVVGNIAWNPTTIPNCTIWLDAADGSTIDTSSNTLVNFAGVTCVCYYPFDSDYYNYATGTGVSDLTFGSGNGTSINTSTKKIGAGSMYINGTGNTYALKTNLPANVNGYSVALWFYVSALPSSNMLLWSFGQTFNTLNGYLYYLILQSNGNMIGSTPGANPSCNFTCSAGNWYHVVITYSTAGTWNVYVNNSNTVVNSNLGYLSYASTLSNLCFGQSCYSVSGTSSSNVYIDEFRYYDGVLTSAQVSLLYNYYAPSYVSRWNDKSGLGNNFTSLNFPKTGTKTLNGLNIMDLSSNNTSCFSNTSIQLGTTYSVFAVAYTTGNATDYTRLVTSLTNVILCAGTYTGTSNFATFTGNSTNWNDISVNLPATSVATPTLMEFTFTSSAGGLIPYINGTAQTAKNNPYTYTTPSFTGLGIGSYFSSNVPTGQYWNGYIAEIVIYSSVLTTTQRQTVEGYLAWKWGLSGSLPSTHPYSSISPYTYFIPNSISGNYVWLDATSSWSLTTSSGNVSKWADKSVSKYDMSQNTVGYSPTTGSNTINTLNVLNFSSNKWMNNSLLNLTTNSSVFAVVYGPASQTGYARILSNGAYFYFGDYTATTNFTTLLGNGTTFNNTLQANTPNVSTTGACLLGITANNTSTGLIPYVNGTAQNALNATYYSFAGMFLGANDVTGGQSWGGQIAEVLLYNKALADIDRQTIEGYLAWKWGLQSYLPVTHYYYNTAPTQDILDYQFRIKSLSSTVPTYDTTGTYAITQGSVAVSMIYDTTRGYVFNFTGSAAATSYMSLPTSASNTGNNLTRTFWINTGVVSSSYSNNIYSGQNWPIYLSNISGNTYKITSAPNFGSGGGSTVDTTVRYENQWIFIATTITSTQTLFYVNGSLIATGTGTNTVSTTDLIYFGAWKATSGGFIGQLDDMRQYNYVLTPGQIQQIYNATNLYKNTPRTFNPTLFPGNILWLDAADSKTIASSSGVVSAWNDKSGMGNNFTAFNSPKTGTSTINGLNVIDLYTNNTSYFTSANMTMTSTWSIFSIDYMNTAASGKNVPFITSISTSSLYLMYGQVNNNYRILLGDGNASWVSVADATFSTTSACLMGATNDGTNKILNMYGNGKFLKNYNSYSTPYSSFTGLNISRNAATGYDYWTGYAGEILIYNTVLSAIHRQTVEGYLAWKWGLQSNLPSDHVFYNAAPQPDLFNYQFRLKNTSSTIITTDATNAYSITNTGTVTVVNDVVRGYVFYFNGANYLSMPSTATTNGNCTRTFWAKTYYPTTGSGNLFSSTNWPIRFNGTNYLNSTPGATTSVTDPTNEGSVWVFYACTISGTTANLYVNGNTTPVATATLASAFTGDTNAIQFGALNGAGFFTGYLDDIRQYNYTLSPSQIAIIYYSTLRNLNFNVKTAITVTPTISSIAISNDGNKMLVAPSNGTGSNAYVQYSTTPFTSFTSSVLSNASGTQQTFVALNSDGSRGIIAGAVSPTNVISFFTWTSAAPSGKTTFDTTARAYSCLDMTPDGSRIVAGTQNGGVLFSNWSGTNYNTMLYIDSGNTTNTAITTTGKTYQGVAISSDGNYVAFSDGDSTNTVYVATYNTTLGYFINNTSLGSLTSYGATRKIKFSPNGKYLFVSLYNGLSGSVGYFKWNGVAFSTTFTLIQTSIISANINSGQSLQVIGNSTSPTFSLYVGGLTTTTLNNLNVICNETHSLNLDPTLSFFYLFKSTDVSGTTVYNYANGTYDATLVGANATVTTSQTYNSTFINSSLSLQNSGTSYLQMNTSFTHSTNGFTITCWFNNSNATSNTYARLLLLTSSTASGSAHRTEFFITYSTGNIPYVGITNNPASYYETSTTGSALNDSTWRHFAWVILYSASGPYTNYIYINGSLATTFTTTYYPDNTARAYNYIGYNIYSNPFFTGYINDYRIYNRSLTATEISSLYSSFY